MEISVTHDPNTDRTTFSIGGGAIANGELSFTAEWDWNNSSIVNADVGAWRHSIQIKEYRKSKDELPIYFNYWTRIETTKEQAIKKAVDIAQEIYQFLQKSQVNQFSKQEK